eukprot:TRINITY_DN10805_c0_g2_i6.p1 TRINITY_DN10805_c0_g2~~TRINITY_DN10805_c0_g2_i6.p1  ORF type:complete len:323 (+),score=72.88 TRINITY_DN10805_c0_g2_i6:66-1034(+)
MCIRDSINAEYMGINFEDYFNTRMVVERYADFIDNDYGIIPHITLLRNCDNNADKQPVAFEWDGDFVVGSAARSFQKGDRLCELFQFATDIYFQLTGKTLQNNFDECINVKTQIITPNDQAREEKLELINSSGLFIDSEGYTVMCISDKVDSIIEEVYFMLIMSVVSKRELEKKILPEITDLVPILAQMLQKQNQSFKTRLDEDIQRLNETSPDNFELFNALTFRVNRRFYLQRIIEHYENLDPDQFEANLKEYVQSVSQQSGENGDYAQPGQYEEEGDQDDEQYGEEGDQDYEDGEDNQDNDADETENVDQPDQGDRKEDL